MAPSSPSSDEYGLDELVIDEEALALIMNEEDKFNLELSQIPQRQRAAGIGGVASPVRAGAGAGAGGAASAGFNVSPRLRTTAGVPLPATTTSMYAHPPIPTIATVAAANTNANARQPAAKKFKPNTYRPIAEDVEPPEITIDKNGNYSVVGRLSGSGSGSGSGSYAPASRPPQPPPPLQQAHARQLSGPAAPMAQPARPAVSTMTTTPAVTARPPPPPRPVLGGRSSSSSSSTGAAHVQPLRSSPLARGQPTVPSQSRPLGTATVPAAGTGTQWPVHVPMEAPPPAVKAELENLRRQLDELRNQNESLQAAKVAAEEMHYQKAGEAANMRRMLDRANTQNVENIAKLKAEKEEVLDAKAKVEREMKMALDRMKTDMTFKQHELETTTRKPTWSVRKRPTHTQVAGPSQLQPLPGGLFGQTPARSPSRAHAGSSRPPSSPAGPVPAAARKGPGFNGFQNSFAPSQRISPSRARARREATGSSPVKGKEKERENQAEADDGDGWAAAGEREPESVGHHEEMQVWEGPVAEDGGQLEKEDVPMSEVANTQAEGEEMEVDLEEESFFGPVGEGVNWREELHHTIFSHRSLLYSSDDPNEPPPLTIQLLLTVALPDTTDAETSAQYKADCSSVLGAFGRDHPVDDVTEDGSFEELGIVARGLVRLAKLFCDLDLIKPLALCFDLITFITFHIPACRHVILGVASEDPDSPPTMLSTLRDCVCRHLLPAQMEESAAERRALADASLGLVETVVWRVSEEDVPKLGVLPTAKGFLSSLLHPSQPPWLTERAVRMICLLSTYATLFRPLLSFPDEDTTSAIAKNDITRIPLIDLLCEFLVNPPSSASFEQVHTIVQAALCTLTVLSVSHADGRPLLIESRSLISSLVRCLLSQSTVLWDEDDSIIDSPERHAMLLQTLQLCLTLLHHLAQHTTLRDKLQQASRNSNGLAHAFILAIGRLSYADAPEWLSTEDISRVEAMREQARDLIESVIEGPEGDLIWEAYQDAGDDSDSATEPELEPEEPEQPEMIMDVD